MRRLLKKILFSFLFLFYSWPNPTIALLNFSNQSGQKGLAYLASSIPDSISTVLSENQQITVLERRELGKILKEHSLSLSGLIKQETALKIARILKAGCLLLGSYSGSAENLRVNIRMIDIKTTKVIFERIIISSLGELFDKTTVTPFKFPLYLLEKNWLLSQFRPLRTR